MCHKICCLLQAGQLCRQSKSMVLLLCLAVTSSLHLPFTITIIEMALLFDVMPFQCMVISQGFDSHWGHLASVESLTDHPPLKWHHTKQQCQRSVCMWLAHHPIHMWLHSDNHTEDCDDCVAMHAVCCWSLTAFLVLSSLILAVRHACYAIWSPDFGPGMPLPGPTPNDHVDPPCLATLLQQQCSCIEDGFQQQGACLAFADMIWSWKCAFGNVHLEMCTLEMCRRGCGQCHQWWNCKWDQWARQGFECML